MKKIMIIIPLIYINSFGDVELKSGTFKTKYFYINNPNITEKRVEECKTMNEMTFAIEKDCSNALSAKRHIKLYKKTKKYDRTPAKGGEMQRVHNKTY